MEVSMVKNKKKAEKILKALEKNDGYCPCRLQKTEDTKCMCKEFRQQIIDSCLGECHCGLYEILDD